MATKTEYELAESRQAQVASEALLEEMKTNGQLTPHTHYFTPDGVEVNYVDKADVNTNMLGVPSSRFISISGASSGATFTPPENGYIAFKGVATKAQSQVNVVPNNDNYPAFYYVFGVASYGQAVYVPVKKGVTYNIFYDGLNQSHAWGFYIRFYYAEEV